MNIVEYWLLDNALECELPFYHLDSEFDEYAVRQLWAYEREKLLDGLEAIIERNEIIVHDGSTIIKEIPRSLLNEFIDSECKAYLNDGWVPPTYRLSDLGGHVWEETTNPNWDDYVAEDWSDFDDGTYNRTMLLKATSRGSIEQYLQGRELHYPYTSVKGTEVWEPVKPLQITYWKTLPAGIRLTCQAIYDRDKPSTGDACRIWCESRRNWYTPPAFAEESN